MDLYFKGDVLWKTTRTDADGPSVERTHPKDASGLSEGGEEFSGVFQKVT